ncbi:MAG: hypothetical protein QM632_04330 [Micrococcaceae bacterium]
MTSNVLPPLPAQFRRGDDIYEIKVGVFASQEEILHDIFDTFSDMLASPEKFGLPQIPYDMSFVGPDAQVSPDPNNLTTVAELYLEQQDSWQALHIGQDPEDRKLHEIRIGLYGTEEQAYLVQSLLLNHLSPMDAHGAPLLDNDYQWKTWILSPVQHAGEYGNYTHEYLYARHGDIIIDPKKYQY